MKFGGKKRGLTWMLCGLMLLCMQAGAEQSAMQAEISDEMQIDSAREIEDLQAWAQEEITDEMLLPEVDRQAELAAAKEKTRIPWRGCISPAQRWTKLWCRGKTTGIIST